MSDDNNNNENGNIMDKVEHVKIEKQMRDAYIDYAMSVIVSRALPDVRDGLKPVHRRILHSMNELNLDPNKPHKKSARIVGDTMGKYHPHGESSIYDALVRLAQPFSTRYMLVDGHGNFGSLDGDQAAAQRYTEARLSKIAMELLRDIEKDTVDFIPNYDEEFKEPTVMPSRFPNLLVNGSVGIAVGMATNIPPHNLKEIIDAVLKIIDNDIEGIETDVDDLLDIVKGPDFPTGANIVGKNGIKQAYRTGRGKIIVRSECEIQTAANGRQRIVISEIPYQVNKAKMQQKIADLVKEKKLDGISNIWDESSKGLVRVVVELKKDANANVVLNHLYKYSQVQESFGVIMLALVDGEPKVLNLLQMCVEYLKHQKKVVRRRTLFELNKAEKRAHILEGFLKALDHIDEIIAIIRANREISVSKSIIMEKFGFTVEQADAIVEMRLRNLSGLEKERLEKEYNELMILIDKYKSILADEKMLYGVIKEELTVIRDKYGDERRTKILPYEGEIEDLDLIDDEMNVITMSSLDYIKRLQLNTYRSQNRGGRGIMGMTTRDEDIVEKLFIASTHDQILFFTDFGRVYRLLAYMIPEAGRTARGTAIVNLLNLNAGERIAAVVPVKDYGDEYLCMVTKKGVIKKTPLSMYSRVKQNGLFAINIREDDELISVMKIHKDDEIIVVTNDGNGVRFPESDVRSVGRQATGVRAIRLRAGDFVIGAEVLGKDCKLLTVSAGGFGKCTMADEFKLQKRGGMGVKVYKCTPKTGKLVGIAVVCEKEEFMIINSEGVIIRIRVSDISTIGRNTQGVKLINLDEGVSVVGMAKIEEEFIEVDGHEHLEPAEIIDSYEDEVIETIESEENEQED